MFHRLRDEFPDASFRFVTEEGRARDEGDRPEPFPDDVVLLLCGCRSECLDYSRFVGRRGRILLFAEEDYALAAAFLRSWEEEYG